MQRWWHETIKVSSVNLYVNKEDSEWSSVAGDVKSWMESRFADPQSSEHKLL